MSSTKTNPKRDKGNTKKPGFKVKNQLRIEKQEIDKLDKLKSKLGDSDSAEITTFSVLPLSEKTQKGLSKNGFTEPTDVQRQTLLYSLRGLDVVAAAKTGSGKTLAFIIPVLELLYSKLWSNVDGLGALIITPTRELAYQIFEVFKKIGSFHNFSVGLVIGGKDLKYEWKRISFCNILICTPGRILQHMTENHMFVCDNVQIQVLDEADQCLSMGFAETMNDIFTMLPTDRQTLLFSATQTRDVKDLIRAGCKDPIFCSVHEFSKTVTPKTLRESYMVCNDYDKITFLWSFLKHHQKNKVLVFLSTCKQVKFFSNLFTLLRCGLLVMGLRGDMHQLKRMAVYDDFCKKKFALLFATDVAARGLDIPAVDWVIQVDCPEDVTTYIHRVGRTARYSKSGEGLLLLTPTQEETMVASLTKRNIPIDKIDVNGNKLYSIQQKVELSISKHLNLKEDAVRAFKAYLKNIAYMKNRKVFDVTTVNFDMLARSFGMTVTPRVRFVERQLKGCTSKQTSDPARPILDPKVGTLKTFNLGLSQDDDSEDDFLVQSKSQPLSDPGKLDDILTDLTLFTKTEQPFITKYQIAKKATKNKLQLNKRIVFEDEDDELPTETKDHNEDETSAAGHRASGIDISEAEHRASGIDISEMQDQMKEKDKVDKKLNSQRLKEKRRKEKAKLKQERKWAEDERKLMEDERKLMADERKLKEEKEYEEESEESEVDDDFTKSIIDALPDPDQVYRKKKTLADSDARSESSEDARKDAREDAREEDSSSDEEEQKTKREFKGKRKAKEESKRRKRVRTAAETDLSAISFNEKEDLALFLLKGSK